MLCKSLFLVFVIFAFIISLVSSATVNNNSEEHSHESHEESTTEHTHDDSHETEDDHAEVCIPDHLKKDDDHLVLFKRLGEYEWTESECNDTFVSSYYVSQHLKLTWANAFLFCRSFDMELAMFETKAEQDHVLQMIEKNWLNVMEHQNFIGGSKVGSENWSWVGNGNEIGYNLKWKNGEPNNIGGVENCLAIGHYYSSFAVIDLDCYNTMRNFICEKIDEKPHEESHDHDQHDGDDSKEDDKEESKD